MGAASHYLSRAAACDCTHSASLFFSIAGPLPGLNPDPSILVISCVKVWLINGYGCAQGSVKLGKVYSSITSNAYTSSMTITCVQANSWSMDKLSIQFEAQKKCLT